MVWQENLNNFVSGFLPLHTVKNLQFNFISENMPVKNDSIIPNNSFELKTSKVTTSTLENTQTSGNFNESNMPNYQITNGFRNDSYVHRSFNETNVKSTFSGWNMKTILPIVVATLLCLVFLVFLLFMVYKLFKKPSRTPEYFEMEDMNSETPIVKLSKTATYSMKNNSVQLE